MVCRIVNKVGVRSQEYGVSHASLSGVWLTPRFAIRNQEKENYLITTDNCTGEAFGELFLAMTDNLSSKCDHCTGEAFGELFLAMTDNLSSKCFAPTDN